jgi:AcrR family transcriptional regulator
VTAEPTAAVTGWPSTSLYGLQDASVVYPVLRHFMKGIAAAEALTPEDEREQAMRTQICDAAAKVFERDGLRGATMVDIAVAARVSRKTIYNYFDNKVGLIGAVIATDVRRRVELARESLDLSLPSEELIVEAEMRLYDVAKQSRYVSLLVRSDAFDVTDQVLDPTGPIRAIRHQFWFPILAPMRDAGRLRSDDLAEVAEWLSSFLLVLLALPATFGGGQDRIRQVMARFLVPSVLKQSDSD